MTSTFYKSLTSSKITVIASDGALNSVGYMDLRQSGILDKGIAFDVIE
jgi:hypothetical protein